VLLKLYAVWNISNSCSFSKLVTHSLTTIKISSFLKEFKQNMHPFQFFSSDKWLMQAQQFVWQAVLWPPDSGVKPDLGCRQSK